MCVAWLMHVTQGWQAMRVYKWRRLIGFLKLQDNFRKRATNYRALLQKMTYEDKAPCASTPHCSSSCSLKNTRHDSFMCVTWHIPVCDMTHSCVTHSCVRHDSCVWHRDVKQYECNSAFISKNTRHDSFMCETWLIPVCDMTHLCVRHDSYVWRRDGKQYEQSSALNSKNTNTGMLNRWSTRHKLIYISPTQTAIRLSQTQCVVKVSPIWGLACSTGRVIAQPHIHITNSVSPLCFIVV